MKVILTLLLFIGSTLASFSQEVYKEDSYRRYLFPLPEPSSRSLNRTDSVVMEYRSGMYQLEEDQNRIKWDRFERIYRPLPSSPWISISPDLPYGIFWITDFKNCGDSYHQNGNIYSRCACNEDSVRHGKSVFWDDRGRLTSVAYYYNGKVTSQKRYLNGKLREISKYKNGFLAGEQFLFPDDSTKIINRYKNGNQIGLEQRFVNGTLREEALKGDSMRSYTVQFNAQGDTLNYSYYERKDGFSQMRSAGIWKKYDAFDNSMSYTIFKEGFPVEIHTYIDGILREKHIKRSDKTKDHLFFNVEGDTVSNFSTLGTYYKSTYCLTDFPNNSLFGIQGLRHEYNPSEIYDYDWRDRQLVRRGYIKTDSCTFHYDATQSTEEYPYLFCLVEVDGDTTEQFYSWNNREPFQGILHSNPYKQVHGKYEPHGEWLHFENNKVISAITFDEGELTGPFMMFDTLTEEPRPVLSGHLRKGKFHGDCIQYEGELLLKSRYNDGELEELFVQNFNADTTYNCHNPKQKHPQKCRTIQATLVPMFTETHQGDSITEVVNYWDNDSIHWVAHEKNDVLHGLLQEYDQKGKLLLEGNFTHGQAPLKWTYRKVKRNGKTVYRKKKMEVSLPDMRPISPERRKVLHSHTFSKSSLLF